MYRLNDGKAQMIGATRSVGASKVAAIMSKGTELPRCAACGSDLSFALGIVFQEVACRRCGQVNTAKEE